MRPLPVYLLAGGRSSRFGTDKARVEIATVPLIVRLARWLEPVAASLVAVADRRDKYQDLGLTTIADILPGMGPLGGLHAALSHAGGLRWTLVVSCDWLELKSEWLDELERHVSSHVHAVVYRDQWWQAFPGLYHTALLPLIEQHISEGSLAMARLLEQAPIRGLALPADWPAVVQANSQEELEAYVRAADTH